MDQNKREWLILAWFWRWGCGLIATGFGLGKSPLAPGTVGSMGAAGAVWLFFPHHPGMQLLWILPTVVLGYVASKTVSRVLAVKDPSEVVIDEIAGIFITFFWLPMLDIWVLGTGFLLFRIFDISKPWLVGKADRLGGPWGIMLDDMIAGVFANLLLQFAVRWLV